MGRATFFVVPALVAAGLLISDATAQQRNNQPQAQPQRQRGPDPAPGGFQNEAVDLNEGKSPGELFKSGCAVCHNSAAGLAKGRSESQLAGFLRQHYTSGTQHAAALAGFLAANGRGPATATPARLNPNAPVDRSPGQPGRADETPRPPSPVGREEAARPQEREPAAKRKPHEKQPPVAARPATPASAPAAPASPPAATEAAAHSGDTPAPSAPPPAPAVEEKPAPPEIPL